MVALRQSALPSEYLGPPGVTNINKLLRPMPPVKQSDLHVHSIGYRFSLS